MLYMMMVKTAILAGAGLPHSDEEEEEDEKDYDDVDHNNWTTIAVFLYSWMARRLLWHSMSCRQVFHHIKKSNLGKGGLIRQVILAITPLACLIILSHHHDTVYINPGGARNVFKSAAAETEPLVTM